MSISFLKRDNILIVKVYGDIDHHNSEEIRRKVEHEFNKGNIKNILLDYENVSFMDSSGIGMVIGRYRQVTAVGGSIAVINLSREVEQIFKLSGLFKIIKCYKNMESALKSFQQGGIYNV